MNIVVFCLLLFAQKRLVGCEHSTLQVFAPFPRLIEIHCSSLWQWVKARLSGKLLFAASDLRYIRVFCVIKLRRQRLCNLGFQTRNVTALLSCGAFFGSVQSVMKQDQSHSDYSISRYIRHLYVIKVTRILMLLLLLNLYLAPVNLILSHLFELQTLQGRGSFLLCISLEPYQRHFPSPCCHNINRRIMHRLKLNGYRYGDSDIMA